MIYCHCVGLSKCHSTPTPIDAHLELDGSDIVFHSRGGARGTTNAKNTEYGKGLELILKRLDAAGLSVDRVWVDSTQARKLPPKEREILGVEDRNLSLDETRRLLLKKMRAVGRSKDITEDRGNSTKRIRIQLQGKPSQEKLIETLKIEVANKESRALKRLPREYLNKVTAENIWSAIGNLIDGTAKHGFSESTDYDVLVGEGVRLPPKAVFGVAASEALGYEVLPENFSAGLNSQCFRILQKCGYEIVAKEPSAGVEPPPPPDREWLEGRKKAVAHFKKERAVGLSPAKKSQFKRENDGRLFCERCKMDPVKAYGPTVGEACIEVHHSKIHVKDMDGEHRTRLEDLQCLCANCHRVVHRELKIADSL